MRLQMMANKINRSDRRLSNRPSSALRVLSQPLRIMTMDPRRGGRGETRGHAVVHGGARVGGPAGPKRPVKPIRRPAAGGGLPDRQRHGLAPSLRGDPGTAPADHGARTPQLGVDPMCCPKCGTTMRIIGSIEPQPSGPHSAPPDLWQSLPPPWAPGQPRAQGVREAFSG
jgi:hypothetical protein